MRTSERELDERAGRLLSAGRPAYPEDLDRRLRERLARVGGEKHAVPLRRNFLRWALAAPAVAVVLLIAAWLIRTPSRSSAPPAMAGVPARGDAPAAAGPRSLPVPPAAQAARSAPQPVPGVERRPARRADGRRGAAPKEPVRLEFTIPEREITILWEQQSNFDLAALVAAR